MSVIFINNKAIIQMEEIVKPSSDKLKALQLAMEKIEKDHGK